MRNRTFYRGERKVQEGERLLRRGGVFEEQDVLQG